MGIFDFLKPDTSGLEQALTDANAATRAAEQRSIESREEGKANALGQIQPGIEAGDLARENELVALGLRGRDAQTGFFDDFQTDPGFTEAVTRGLDLIGQSNNAAGRNLSGANLRDLTSFATDQFLNTAFFDRLNRLSSLSQVGLNARTNAANVETGTAAQIADTQFGAGQLRANNIVNAGNVQAQASQAGVNNLVGLATALIGGGSKIASAGIA